MLIFLKQLFEDRAVDHVADYAYIEVLSLRFVSASSFNGLTNIFLNQSKHLLKVFIENHQNKLQTLSLIFCTIFSLSLDKLE